MRLSIVGPAHPLRGGIAHHVYWIRRQMEARGHDVQVISYRKLYPSLLFPGTSERDASDLKFDAQAAAILSPLNPASWLRAARAVERFGPDAVLLQWWQPYFAPVLGTLARRFRRKGLRVIVECHNVSPHEGSPADRLLTRFAFAAADEFIVHARSDEEGLRPLAGDRPISVSPLPAPDQFKASQQGKRDGRRLLFFGKVRRYKGLDVLLEALPKVLARVACELWVVGEFYEDVETYRRIIRKNGVERHVRLIDRYVTNEEVADYFAQADALVLPYTSASQSAVAQIALANDLPIIASRAGGLCDGLTEGEDGLSFRPGDSNELADKIVSYFTNGYGPAFAGKLRARRLAGKACRIAEIIESAAHERPGNPAFARLDNGAGGAANR
jgi:glycosyltransferase involved in cell wall biosynthesis